MTGVQTCALPISLKKGWINIYEPYREVHKENLKAVHEYYKDKPLLKLD